jgi:4-oxalocrotonate tautomerase
LAIADQQAAPPGRALASGSPASTLPETGEGWERAVTASHPLPTARRKPTCRFHRLEEAPVPFVRIDLVEGKSAEFCKNVGEIVYQAMRDIINVPENDKFQVITPHPRDEINVAASYLGNRYSDGIILIQITLTAGRSVELKQAFYKRIADDLHAKLQVRREDVIINLVETVKENWSFGGGIAQYVT